LTAVMVTLGGWRTLCLARGAQWLRWDGFQTRELDPVHTGV